MTIQYESSVPSISRALFSTKTIATLLRGFSTVGTKQRCFRSKIWVPLQREVPRDVFLESHKLMTQSGMITKSAAGIYTLLPLCVRSLEKLTKIVDEELQASGAHKLWMPTLISSELWTKTGRWNLMHSELFKVEDKKGQQYCLGPTHEELVTDIVANSVSSYRQLPLKLYQITSKFRDEIRPKYGLMRAREFVMMDMYSFDCSQEEAFATYDNVKSTFQRIFDRIGMKYAIVEADSGSIGGNRSHEFHFISNVGDDTIFNCNKCDYISNAEKARSSISMDTRNDDLNISSLLANPAIALHWCELKKGSEVFHSIVATHSQRVLNPIKVKAHFNADDIKVHSDAAIPASFSQQHKLYVCLDNTAASAPSNSTPSTTEQKQSISQLIRENPFEVVKGDFKLVQAQDCCPRADCNGTLVEQKGIEVGHIFYLGSKYSKPMNSHFTTALGEKKDVEMGCYGLGMTRILASVIECSHDQHGLIWPPQLAPYKIMIIPTSSKDTALVDKCYEIYDTLEENGFKGDVVIDDRDEQPGFKMNDARFLGFPWVIVSGKAMKEEGKYELQIRKTGEKLKLNKDELLNRVKSFSS